MFTRALAQALDLRNYSSLSVFVATVSIKAQQVSRRRLQANETAWEIVLRVALLNSPGVLVSDLAAAVSASPLLLKDYLAESMCGAFQICPLSICHCGSRQRDCRSFLFLFFANTGGFVCQCDDSGACTGPQFDIPVVFPSCNLDMCIVLDESGSIFAVTGAWDIETALVRLAGGSPHGQ